MPFKQIMIIIYKLTQQFILFCVCISFTVEKTTQNIPLHKQDFVRFSDRKLPWILRYPRVFSMLTDVTLHFSNYFQSKIVFSYLTMRGKGCFIYMTHGLVSREKSTKLSARIQLFYNRNNKTVHYSSNTTILLRRWLRSQSHLVF